MLPEPAMKTTLKQRRLSRSLMLSLSLLGILALGGCVTAATPRDGGSEAGGALQFESLAGSYLTARHAHQAHDVNIASDHIRFVLEQDPDNIALLRRALLIKIEHGERDATVAIAKRLDALRAQVYAAQLVLGLEAIRNTDYTTAWRHFDTLPDTRLNRVLRPLLLAWTAIGRGEGEASKELFKSISTRKGFKRLANLHAAYAAQLRGDVAGADQHFDDALGEPGAYPFRLLFAIALHRARNNDYEGAWKLFRDNPERTHDLPTIGAALERAQEGLPVAGTVSSVAEGISEALFDIASALQRDRGNDASMIYGRLAVMMRPDFPLAQLLLGEIMDDRGRPDQALSIYLSIPQKSVYYTMSRLRTAAGFRALDRSEEAIALLEQLAGERPHDDDPLVRLGDLYRSKKRWVEAANAYDRAIARIGDPARRMDWSLFYTRGIALERSKQWGRAEADFLKALDLRPDQPYVLNYLGYSWVEQGKNLTRAQGLIERAVDLRPDDGYIVDSLGWVLFRTGKYTDAVTHLERAVELRPNDPTINDHLGDAYWRVGRTDEARFQWRRVLSLDPEPELLTTVERKILVGLPAAAPLHETSGLDGKNVPAVDG